MKRIAQKIIHRKFLVVLMVSILVGAITGISQAFVHFMGDFHLSDFLMHVTVTALAVIMVAIVTTIAVFQIEYLAVQLRKEEETLASIKRENDIKEEARRHETMLEMERKAVHVATMRGAYHYLNNILNQFQLIPLQFEMHGEVDKADIEEIRKMIDKTAFELREFGNIANPTESNVDEFIRQRL